MFTNYSEKFDKHSRSFARAKVEFHHHAIKVKIGTEVMRIRFTLVIKK